MQVNNKYLMTHEVDRWDAEEWLQENKDIWNHPMVRDRTQTNGYEVADLMAEFANYILSKQEQKTKDMTQSAVEWLIEQIEKGKIEIVYLDKIHSIKCIPEIIQQAKEMEKQRIKKAWVDGNYNTDDDGNPSENYSISDEQYYNKTYGGNK